MTETDVTKLLDPRGPHLQRAARGMPNEARVAVAAHWGQIKLALEAEHNITTIYNILSEAGLVSISLRSFHRQVLARHEREKGSGSEAKPAGKVEARQALFPPGGSQESEPPQAGPEESEATVKAPAGPRPSWLTEPPPATNRHAIYKPPDPKKSKS